MKLKWCNKCQSYKAPSEFNKHRRYKDGLCPTCRLCMREAVRKAKKNHPETAAEYQRQYRKREPDKYIALARAGAANQAAKQNGAVGRLDASDWTYLIERDKVCLCCGTDENLSLDHIVPLSQQGPNVRSNCQVLCLPCNQHKKNKIIDYRVNGRMKETQTIKEDT